MRALNNAKFFLCFIENTLIVKVLAVGRRRGNFRNIFMTVIEKTDDNSYKLANKKGSINKQFLMSNFPCVIIKLQTKKINHWKRKICNNLQINNSFRESKVINNAPVKLNA